MPAQGTSDMPVGCIESEGVGGESVKGEGDGGYEGGWVVWRGEMWMGKDVDGAGMNTDK